MVALERLQILVTAEQRRWLEAESARTGEPVTSLVRGAIDTARSRRSRSQRLEALESIESIWGRSTDRIVELSVDDLNAIIDDGRLSDATRGLSP